MIEIKHLDKLLQDEIDSYQVTDLSAAGDNYGSIMLALDIRLKNKRELLKLVAKLCPRNEFIKILFNIGVTFKKEIRFYSIILPTLKAFEEKSLQSDFLDIFPKYYGSRINLSAGRNNQVDEEACLLLDNLKLSGFSLGNRFTGFNRQTAEFLIIKLARFHAIPICLKRSNSNLFTENLSPFLGNHMTLETISDDMNQAMIDGVVKNALKDEKCSHHIERIKKALDKCSRNFRYHTTGFREPFASIVHNDLWVNNIMLKYDSDQNCTDCRFVDFQLIIHGNPLQDLIFFLFTSLDDKLRQRNFTELINLWYNEFIRTLKLFKVDFIEEEFSYAKFLDELKHAAGDVEFYHICFMLNPIFKDKSKVKNVKDFNANGMAGQDEFSKEYLPKLWSVISDFIDNKWI